MGAILCGCNSTSTLFNVFLDYKCAEPYSSLKIHLLVEEGRLAIRGKRTLPLALRKNLLSLLLLYPPPPSFD